MDYQLFIIARALHVVGVVIWIGGVFFVTMVLLPALKTLPAAQRLPTFERLERRFGWYARAAIALVGVTGYYMGEKMQVWAHLTGHYFSVLLMLIVWSIFALMLFVLEPFVVHRFFHQFATTHPERAFKIAAVMHWILLTVSLIAIIAGVLVARGYPF